jgi:hypothetical protein
MGRPKAWRSSRAVPLALLGAGVPGVWMRLRSHPCSGGLHKPVWPWPSTALPARATAHLRQAHRRMLRAAPRPCPSSSLWGRCAPALLSYPLPLVADASKAHNPPEHLSPYTHRLIYPHHAPRARTPSVPLPLPLPFQQRPGSPLASHSPPSVPKPRPPRRRGAWVGGAIRIPPGVLARSLLRFVLQLLQLIHACTRALYGWALVGFWAPLC